MTKYTAQDFENARFAEHPDGRIAARLQTEEARPWESVRDFHTDEGMAADGWVPVPAKPVLTESRIKKMVGDYAVDEFAAGFAGGFRYAGGEIIPDPEPTNAEKLEKGIDIASRGLVRLTPEQIKSLAEGLEEFGATVKDN